MSTKKTVAMVVSQEAYNDDDEEMRDLIDLALKDDRVRIIYATQEELEGMIDVMRMMRG